MSTDDRIDRLERRIEVLESLLRARASGSADAASQTAPVEIPVEVSVEPAERRNPSVPSMPSPSSVGRRTASLVESEQWIGQRGLLAVGVLALILAAGYLLKLSFDRGWISPVLRCTGGAVAGVVVGAIGWRLHGRYRTYGAALIGCGAAIIYLSVWAGTRLYNVLPPTSWPLPAAGSSSRRRVAGCRCAGRYSRPP